MIKKISELTAKEKERFLNATIKDYERNFHMPWSQIEPTILKDIDDTFDDQAFLKMSPDFQIDTVLCRKEFGNKKPSLVDYILWAGKFVTKSEYVEIPDEE